MYFVDIALEGGAYGDSDIFSFEKTSQFLKTGLNLATEMLNRKVVAPDYARSIVLYTAHYQTSLWTDIENFCLTSGTRRWRKRADADIDEILELALAHITEDDDDDDDDQG